MALSFAHAESSTKLCLTIRSSAPAPRSASVFSSLVGWRGALNVGVGPHTPSHEKFRHVVRAVQRRACGILSVLRLSVGFQAMVGASASVPRQQTEDRRPARRSARPNQGVQRTVGGSGGRASLGAFWCPPPPLTPGVRYQNRQEKIYEYTTKTIGERPMKVFLSHNSANKEFVKQVATTLRKRGLTPWLDIWEMGPGDLLLPTLERAIETCDCFILFWSTDSKAAPWVEWERRNADRLRDKRRICVRLEEIVPPPELSQRIWLDWLTWQDHSTFEPTLQILIRSIYGKPYADPPPSADPSPVPTPQSTLSIHRMEPTRQLFEEMFSSLNSHYGPQNWWVRDNKFQLCLEAILTQGTSWRNVGLAIENLKAENALEPNVIYEMPDEHLNVLIRPCGRAKTGYIKNFVNSLKQKYDLDIQQMLMDETSSLREKLLAIKGIGEFTGDNILLYGADRTKLPINSRMRKVFFEHDLIDEVDTYESVQRRMESVLPFSTSQIREFDAMIYRVARDYCHSTPKCEACPLKQFLPGQGPRSQRT